MSQEEYAKLAAKYTLWLLYNKGTIDGSSAEGCNLWTLIQEGLGNHDPNPQVPLYEIVSFVKNQMG